MVPRPTNANLAASNELNLATTQSTTLSTPKPNLLVTSIKLLTKSLGPFDLASDLPILSTFSIFSCTFSVPPTNSTTSSFFLPKNPKRLFTDDSASPQNSIIFSRAPLMLLSTLSMLPSSALELNVSKNDPTASAALSKAPPSLSANVSQRSRIESLIF